MYHNVTREARPGGPDDYFSVTRAAFGAHLDAVRSLGLQVVSIADAIAGARPCVAVSFDDGDIGQYENAFPELVARGMAATFFVTTSWVGRPGYVTWDHLRAMRDAGMSIQSHTHSHQFLSELDGPALRAELAESKGRLDRELGQDTDTLALPGGDPPKPGLWPMVAEAGYRVVATSRWGRNRTPLEARQGVALVRRCTVRGAPGSDAFRRIVEGDPWLAVRRGVREWVLATTRRTLGPSRYARWRRRVLSRLDGLV